MLPPSSCALLDLTILHSTLPVASAGESRKQGFHCNVYLLFEVVVMKAPHYTITTSADGRHPKATGTYYIQLRTLHPAA